MTIKRLHRSQPYFATIERSRFIGQTFRISDEQAFADIHHDLAARYPGCSHIAWAFRLDLRRERASDGGEPHGTAGPPILYIIQKHALVETAIAVVRYYGGIPLGRGGLIRAYEGAAFGALSESRWEVATPAFRVPLALTYADHARLAALGDRLGVGRDETFGRLVECTFHCPESLWPEFSARVAAVIGRAPARADPETIWRPE